MSGDAYEFEYCMVCDAVLTRNNIEMHHFPIPKSLGGKETVPLCRTCHDMVDRINLVNWPATWVFNAWNILPREGRLFVMKLYSDSIMGNIMKGKRNV